ncbi:transcriptional regulator [Deltaproteobacteria bacterium Smac51]|nr:transcriptional regulator [Deltaproteobacteria bacterium Smac51]
MIDQGADMLPSVSANGGAPEIDLRAAFDSLPHGVTITDTEGYILYYNDVQCKIDGLSKEEVIGRHICEVYVPSVDNSPTLMVLRTHQPIYDLFMIYETKKGVVVNSTHTVLPLFKNGRIIGSLCLIHPISQTKTEPTQEELAALESIQFSNLIGSSPIFRASINAALAAADSPSSVLIYGETGSGKGLLARQLHDHSQRSARPYVAINCSAIPATLLEGTLFGSVKGAFTGSQNSPGLFEEADGGTVYLDEVDSMPLELQPKLLRVIQERKVRRVGSIRERDVDIKLISSFSGDPLEAVRDGRVRADLFYRLGVVIVQIPPLRERVGDLPGLMSFLMNKHMTILKKKNIPVSTEVMSVFKSYDWPGNVRELENVIEGALNMIKNGETIGLNHLPIYLQNQQTPAMPLPPQLMASPALPPFDHGDGPRRPGRREIVEAMSHTCGSLKDAARRLGISRQLLSYHLKKYGLTRQEFDV